MKRSYKPSKERMKIFYSHGFTDGYNGLLIPVHKAMAAIRLKRLDSQAEYAKGFIAGQKKAIKEAEEKKKYFAKMSEYDLRRRSLSLEPK